MPSTTNQSADLSTVERTLSDGRDLAYTTGGDPKGDPVVVHHGTPGSRLFAALVSDVAVDEGIRLIAPDRPGYGRSSPPPTDWTLSDWRSDLHELLDAESIERAGLVGFSGGGPFAFAAADSQRITKLGLISTAVPPSKNGLTRLSRVPFALPLLFRFSSVVSRVVGSGAIVQQYTDRSVSQAVGLAVATDFRESLRQGAKAPTREIATFADASLDRRQLTIPVRIWHGKRDANAPLSRVRSLARDIDATLVPSDTDHLGTLLDSRRDVFEWFGTK